MFGFGGDKKERKRRERQTLTNLDLSAATFRRHGSQTDVRAVGNGVHDEHDNATEVDVEQADQIETQPEGHPGVSRETPEQSEEPKKKSTFLRALFGLLCVSFLVSCSTIAQQFESVIPELQPASAKLEEGRSVTHYDVPEASIVHIIQCDLVELDDETDVTCCTESWDVRYHIDNSENHWIGVIESMSDQRCEARLEELARE